FRSRPDVPGDPGAQTGRSIGGSMDVGHRGNGTAAIVRLIADGDRGARGLPSATSAPLPADPMHDRLRDDVRLLGDLLGEVLREQEGESLFALVERVRALAKRARSEGAEPARELRELMAGRDPAEALPLARAFSHFLALTNIAEQHHRTRLYREARR